MYPQQPQYPQQPAAPYPPAAPQGYPPAAPQGYPAAPPAYPPQAYPPAQPEGGYPPPPQYAPYPPAPQYAPPPPPPVAGTLDQFYAQPSTGGGKALTFEQPGQSYTGIVTRPIGNGDIQQQTDTQNRPATFRDGRPKFVMKVPLQMQPTAAYTDGLAQWYVKGAARDELVRAMAEAGAPEGPPEAGSVITITMTGTRPSGAGMNPTKLFQVIYRRPQGAPGPAAAPAPAPVVAAHQAAPATAPAPSYQPAPPPVYAVNSAAPQTMTTAAMPPAPVAPPPIAPPPIAAPPAELSAEQQELLARLTGAPQPA